MGVMMQMDAFTCKIKKAFFLVSPLCNFGGPSLESLGFSFHLSSTLCSLLDQSLNPLGFSFVVDISNSKNEVYKTFTK